jgi:general secretion pathway protein D
MAVTLEEALDMVAIQSKAFWKPISRNAILIVPDQPQKRRDQEEQVIRTFYLSNTLSSQELTEVATGLRQLLDLRHVQQLNTANAIIIRDTPDKLLLAEKLIRDVDMAKPEVMVQVSVLQVRRDRLRSLGIQPGTSSALAFTPSSALTGGSGGSVPLNRLRHLSTADYSLTLPGAVASALLTDSATKIIQNPEIRIVDGQSARLRVGDRVPVATGSFQAGVTGGGGAISPLVNTQFQYQDVGVNVDITPRVHAERDISMKVVVEVSSVTGRVNIGGIEQPVISQRRIDHDIRLREYEASILGGLLERTERKSVSGWPGLSQIPVLRYFFSGETVEAGENEVLIVLTPRIVRLPVFTEANLSPISIGTDTNIQLRRPYTAESPLSRDPALAPPPNSPAVQPTAPESQPAREAPPGPETKPEPRPRLRLQPEAIRLRLAETTLVDVVVEDVKDLFSVSMLLRYDPAVVSVEEVHHGGFLSGGTQDIAIIQRVDPERGQAMIAALRQPNSAGVNGGGTVLSIVLRAVAAGTSSLTVEQTNARDSRQRPQPLTSSGISIRVE